MKMDALRISETSVSIDQSAMHDIPKDDLYVLHKSKIAISVKVGRSVILKHNIIPPSTLSYQL